jgi:hypothetical protein
MLADNHEGITEVWRFLSSLPMHEVYFAKILHDKDETACLNRNNSPLHIAAAVSAARFETPSVVHYRGADGQIQSSTVLSNIVQTYLTRRLRLAPKAMINEIALFSSPHEVVEYHSMLESSESDVIPSAGASLERGRALFLSQPPART